MRKGTLRLWTCWSLGFALGTLPSLAGAQSGSEIMRQALDAQAERLSSIENITLTQEVMGMETTLYMEKRDVEGTPVLMPVSVSMGGTTNPIPQDVTQIDWTSPFQEAWIDRANLEGEEEIGGERAFVLAVDDFSGLELPGMPSGPGSPGDIEPRAVRMWLDADDFLVRKVTMDMDAQGPEGTPTPVHMEMIMEDYREVEGYLHPFVTRTVTQGLMGATDLDPEEVRAQLAELRSQLENVPEAQRAMVEGMLGAQIERLEGMLDEKGGMEMTITVKNLQVNQGPPGGG